MITNGFTLQSNPRGADGEFIPLRLPGRDMEAAAAAMRREVDDGPAPPDPPWNMITTAAVPARK